MPLTRKSINRAIRKSTEFHTSPAARAEAAMAALLKVAPRRETSKKRAELQQVWNKLSRRQRFKLRQLSHPIDWLNAQNGYKM